MRDDEFNARLRSGATELGASANPPSADAVRRRGDRRRRHARIASGVLAFAVGAGGGGVAYASLGQPGHTLPPAAGGSPTPTTAAASSASAAPPAGPRIVVVTTAGAVQVISAATGVAASTLVPGGDAIGDEIAVSPSGLTVYFAVKHGCTDDIESVPATGGKVTVVTTGVLPAVSPDGSKLAFVREPEGSATDPVEYGCTLSAPPAGPMFKVVVLSLVTGSQQVYPAPPAQAQLPYPISHLSWSPDSQSILVSVGPSQDNGGWGLAMLDPATASYYLPAPWPGISALAVPVTGSPDAASSYYEEGVFLPDGDIFVDRMCCSGVPVHTTSSLLQEISASGQLVHQVAIGFLNRRHTSLDGYGSWLLYLSAHDLFVSHNGQVARKLSTGFIAAAWLPL